MEVSPNHCEERSETYLLNNHPDRTKARLNSQGQVGTELCESNQSLEYKI